MDYFLGNFMENFIHIAKVVWVENMIEFAESGLVEFFSSRNNNEK